MLSVLGAGTGVSYEIVVALARMLAPIAGGLATAAAIVAFTIAVRLLLLPLSYYSVRGQARMFRLLPQVRDIQRRYARQPDRMQRELSALYAREGTGMLGGCLPMLAQLPFFSIAYRLFRSPVIGGRTNGLLSRNLLGAPLGSHWLAPPGPLIAHGAVFLGLFALLAIVGWATARASRRVAAESAGSGSAGRADGVVAVVSRLLPYATIGFAALVPLAAGLYLLTTTAWTLAERPALACRVLRAGHAGLPSYTRSEL